MSAVSVIVFDQYNKQKNYQSIARNLFGELVIGWIVIEQPWYSTETDWTYWMYSNEYQPGGICGGAMDLGLTRCEVYENTIKPFTQIEEIKYALECGTVVKLVEDFFDSSPLAIIKKEEDIPYELWEIPYYTYEEE